METSPHTTRIRLIEARKQRMWSQQELADTLGTTQNTVSRWELGKTTPSPYFTKKMCEIFDKAPQELGLYSKAAISQPLPVLHPVHIILPSEAVISQPIPWTAPHKSKRDRIYLFRFFLKIEYDQ